MARGSINVPVGPLTDERRLHVIRSAETWCVANGVEAFDLSTIAKLAGESRDAVAASFPNEGALLDGVLERHQRAIDAALERALPTIEAPREAVRLIVGLIADKLEDRDGGEAYVCVTTRMCSSHRFPLTGRPGSTTPAALKLMSKLTAHTKVPFELMPIRYDRFAAVLFHSVHSWFRHGAARLARNLFIEDLVDTLLAIGLQEPSRETRALLAT